ncbi:hypothetical protein BDZ89DRAFT_229417 [Hymenopellis radicata]|nr:hypothetical protein BDZ89DRAFT_229417 [Hymenopellis radicata]
MNGGFWWKLRNWYASTSFTDLNTPQKISSNSRGLNTVDLIPGQNAMPVRFWESKLNKSAEAELDTSRTPTSIRRRLTPARKLVASVEVGVWANIAARGVHIRTSASMYFRPFGGGAGPAQGLFKDIEKNPNTAMNCNNKQLGTSVDEAIVLQHALLGPEPHFRYMCEDIPTLHQPYILRRTPRKRIARKQIRLFSEHVERAKA